MCPRTLPKHYCWQSELPHAFLTKILLWFSLLAESFSTL